MHITLSLVVFVTKIKMLFAKFKRNREASFDLNQLLVMPKIV